MSAHAFRRAGSVRRQAAAVLLTLPLAACVATRQDVQLLRTDIAQARAEQARADTARRRELDRALAAIAQVEDSVRALAARSARFQGDARDALRAINEQLLTVQELTGQSQRRLQELRATMEARATEAGAAATASPPATSPEAEPAPAPTRSGGTRVPASGSTGGTRTGAGGAAGTAGGAASTATGGATGTRASRSIPLRDTTAPAGAASGNGTGTAAGTTASTGNGTRATPAATDAPADGESTGAEERGGPGPNELYQLSLDQFRRGSFGTARSGFQELLRRYPTADVAAEAQFYVAEAYASERNARAADDAYAAVVKRYPQSPRAATALYKRARAAQAAGRRGDARTLYEEVARRWPRSDEAVLARDAVRALGRE